MLRSEGSFTSHNFWAHKRINYSIFFIFFYFFVELDSFKVITKLHTSRSSITRAEECTSAWPKSATRRMESSEPAVWDWSSDADINNISKNTFRQVVCQNVYALVANF